MKSTTHATIISGGSLKLRQEMVTALLDSWHIAPHDVIIPDPVETSIGIAEIRNFSARLQLSPQSSEYTVGVMYDGDRLTPTAQQALLKTLEEPPAKSRIIIAISTSALLLPTVVSRCQLLSLQNVVPYTADELNEHGKQFDHIDQLSNGELLQWCVGLGKTKEELSKFITISLYALRQKNIVSTTNSQRNLRQISLLHNLLRISRYTSTNVNVSLVLERMIMDPSLRNIV